MINARLILLNPNHPALEKTIRGGVVGCQSQFPILELKQPLKSSCRSQLLFWLLRIRRIAKKRFKMSKYRLIEAAISSSTW
jgi:hypothetical protein